MDAITGPAGRGATPPLDFSGYFGSRALSDCSITIETLQQADEAAGTPSAKRQKAAGGSSAADVLPGHAIVLSTSSQWMRRQIESWGAGENAPPQDGNAAGTRGGLPRITLHVRPGQETAAKRLVQYIYEGPSSLPNAAAAAANGASGRETQALLVDMLALSHTYRVPTCGSACLSRLLSVPLPQLAWATVSQVLRLPAVQLGASELRPLIEACLNRLQGDYGDMERVASDAALLQRFCGLPFQAVLQLLLDERTAAASENTVLALVHAWLAQQAAGAGADERRALAGAVRLPQLEPLMLATVVPRMGWLAEVLGVEGLALAAGAARGQFDVAAEPVLSTQVPSMPPAWLRGPRPTPPSVDGPDGPQLTFDWSIPVHQLRQLFEDTSASAAARAASAVATAAAEDLPDEGARTPKATRAPPGDETDGGSTATGGALSLLGAGFFGWRRGGGGAAAAAPAAAGGGGGSVTSTPTKRPLQETAAAPAPATAVQPAVAGGTAAPPQRQPALKLRSQAAVFAGHRFNMVLYFQEAPMGADDGNEGGEDEEVTGNAAAPRSRGGVRGAARRGRARAGSDDAAGSSRARAAAAAAAAAATATNHQQQDQAQKAGGASEGSSRWTVRLAVEAAPCVPLRGPSSVVAFSGRLSAVRGDASPSRSVTGEVDGTTTAGGGAATRSARSTGAGRSAGAGSSLARSGSDAFEDGWEGDEEGAAALGAWEARELPQGSWVRSRACDTGFRDFFGVRLAQGKWDARVFRPFLVGPEGGALRLRCEVHNVR